MKKIIVLLTVLIASTVFVLSNTRQNAAPKRECTCRFALVEKGGQYCKWNMSCYVGPGPACELKNQSASCNEDQAKKQLMALCDCDID